MVESDWAFAHHVRESAEIARRAAETMEQAARELKQLLEPGYGGAGQELIQALRDLAEPGYGQSALEQKLITLLQLAKDKEYDMGPSICIWRDAHDMEQFYVGIKSRIDGKFVVLAYLTGDVIHDLFGKEAETACRDSVEGTPVQIFLTLKVPD
jgi:hypothetical protein